MIGGFLEAGRFGIVPSCLLLLLAGFTVYGPQASYWAVASAIGGAERRGAAIGMLDASAYIFAAAGEAGIGWIVDRAGSTAAIFPTLAGACLLSACLALPSLAPPSLAPPSLAPPFPSPTPSPAAGET